MNNIIQLIADYKEAEKTNLFNRFCVFVDANFIIFLKSLLCLMSVISIVFSCFNGLNYGVQTFVVMLAIIFSSIIILGPLAIIFVVANVFLSKKERILKNLKKTLFTGDIFEIFDKNCEFTTHLLKEEKKYISAHIHEKKGLSAFYIMLLKDEIEESKNAHKIEKNIEEEKEALINNETKVGIMLKTINDI